VAIVSEAPLEGDSYEIVVLRDRSEARGKTPGASGCRFHVSVTVHELDCALRAFRQYQPRRKWFSLGLSAHLTRIDADPAAD